VDVGESLWESIDELLGPFGECAKLDIEYLESVGGKGDYEKIRIGGLES